MIWFKRKKRCKHFKVFGQDWPANMFEVVRFSPYKTDSIGYGISECSECGKRAFSCIGLHMMGPRTCEALDSFIQHHMSMGDFKVMLDKEMAWHKFKNKTDSKDEAGK